MASIYVLKVPEFKALVDISRRDPACRVTDTGRGYYRVESPDDLVFRRKELGFKPAIWYGALTGGFKGRIVEFGRDVLRIASV